MSHVPTAALLVLLVTQRGVADDQSQRPDPPEGFAWQAMEEVNGAVLVPDAWHFSQTSTRDSLVYRVTKEKLEKAGDPFLTGLTVNVIRNVPDKAQVSPTLYAAKYIKDYMEGAEVDQQPKIDQVGKLRRITCYVNKQLPQVDDEVTFRIRLTALANEETGTLYILVFGTPADDWDETYQLGKQLFNPIAIDSDM